MFLKLLGPKNFLFYYPPHRAISFSIDRINLNQGQVNCRICNESHEIFQMPNMETLPTAQDYNLINYYAYMLYPPLFKYGPMLGFHCWMRQVHRQRFLDNYPFKKVAFYGGKLLLEYLFFILFTHVFYCYST